jgi:DNA polymerase III sliding clamp (beta) subunit (PCNA family)
MQKIQHQILLNRASLVSVLRTIQHLLDKKVDNEVVTLEMKIDNHDLVKLTLSDGSIGLKATLNAKVIQMGEAPQTVNLSPSDLYEKIRKIDAEEICLLVDSKSVKLEYKEVELQKEIEFTDSGTFTFAQLTQTTKEMHLSGDCHAWDMDHSTLVNQLKYLKSTMAIDDIREQFRGISITTSKEKLVLWSTDGIKMALTEIRGDFIAGVTGIWPRKFIEAVCSILDEGKGTIRMYQKQVEYELHDLIITSPLINASLLNYEAIINQRGVPTVGVLDATYFTKKLDRIGIVTRNEAAAMLNISDNPHLVAIKSTRLERAEVQFKFVKWSGPEASVYVNVSTLVSFTRVFKGDIVINIYNDTKTIIVHRDSEPYPFYLTKLMNSPE